LTGMNVIRLNFSHGSYKEHKNRINLARFVSQKIGKPIAVLQDLCGPKIRIGDFKENIIELKNGKRFILTTKKIVGDENKVFINYKNIVNEIKKGAAILLDDGKIELKVEKISGDKVYCRVIVGGKIKGRRGVNFPGSYLKISSLTEKDKEDIEFGVKNKVDFMAISFVRNANDILELKKILQKAKADIKIIAKIETQEAVENIDEIIKEAHAVMVARGDLAVEVGAEQVPVLQKMIVKKCNQVGKPAIIATQMLESMINNPVPTRAEVNDIANAIFDGADAVMLSEETTLGKFPIKAIEVMSRVARHTEANFIHEKRLQTGYLKLNNITDSVSYAVAGAAHNIGAKAIVALTESGGTAKMIARYRLKQPILALTSNPKTYNRLSLSFGCYPHLIKQFKEISEVVEVAKKIAFKEKIAKKGEKIVISAGIPFGKSGVTNLLIAETI